MRSQRRFGSVTDYGRPAKSRTPGFRVLIVSEGSKTEPFYIRALKRSASAINVNLEEYGEECGSDPQTVVEFLQDRLGEDNGYDLAFALIDVDGHPPKRVGRANEIIANLKTQYGEKVRLIRSDPCIEFWFILHFEFTRAPFVPVGKKSSGARALERLIAMYPNYAKGDAEALSGLIPLTGTALSNAKKAMLDARETGEANPSTNIFEFFESIELMSTGKWDFNL